MRIHQRHHQHLPALCAAAFLLACPVAWAQATNTNATAGLALRPSTSLGWYAFGGLGSATQNSPANAGGTANLSGSGKAGAFRVGAGWQFRPDLALELAYASLGTAQLGTPSGTASYTTGVASASLVGNFVLADRLRLVGRVGLAASGSSVQVLPIAYSGNSHVGSVLMGVGLRYAVRPEWELTLDYDNYGKVGTFNSGGEEKASAWWLGGRYNF